MRTDIGVNPPAKRGFSRLDLAVAGGTMLPGRGWAAAFASIALVAAGVGAFVAAGGVPETGVNPTEAGGHVVSVLPGSPAWADGIRPGQVVVVLEPGERPQEWQLETTDGVATFRSPMAGTIDRLRSTLPLAVLATILAGIAVALVRGWPRWAGAMAVIAVVIATAPFTIAGDAFQWTAAAILASAMVAVWLASPGGGRRLRVAIGLAVAAIAVGWAVVRFTVPELFDPLEQARAGSLVAGAMLGVFFTVDVRDAIARARQAGFPNRVDLVVLGSVAAIAVASRAVLDVDPWLAIAAAVAIGLVYSRSRRALLAATDQMLMAETRERAALAAIEAERARVARDLHDAPLQELSGVIKTLELVPEASRETTALRDIAQHLRSVAIELHPPQLQDLGLGPALEHLVGQANVGASIPVELDLDDRLGSLATDRLPADTELAIYRIAQEAIANAQRHSGGSLVQVRASIAADHVLLEVGDDGSGIAESDVEAAQRAGRFGLASMRQRAAIASATFSLESGGLGTRVVVEWTRP
jgi:signal transduction histidine kinase